MCSTGKKPASRSVTYPRLHTKKSWYVDFMSFDPGAGKMRRKKFMLDGIPKITDRRKRAAELIEVLTKQLRAGWSPWVNVDDNRGYWSIIKYFHHINILAIVLFVRIM